MRNHNFFLGILAFLGLLGLLQESRPGPGERIARSPRIRKSKKIRGFCLKINENHKKYAF